MKRLCLECTRPASDQTRIYICARMPHSGLHNHSISAVRNAMYNALLTCYASTTCFTSMHVEHIYTNNVCIFLNSCAYNLWHYKMHTHIINWESTFNWIGVCSNAVYWWEKNAWALYARNGLNLRFKSTNLGPKKCYTNQAEWSNKLMQAEPDTEFEPRHLTWLKLVTWLTLVR